MARKPPSASDEANAVLVISLNMAEPAGNTEPFVTVACVCENVLEQADGVVSLIRVVDTYTLTVDHPAGAEQLDGLANIPSGLKLLLFVQLKAGDVTGTGKLSLRLRTVSGKQNEIGEWPVEMIGGVQGVNLRLEFRVDKITKGTHYFDVSWNGKRITCIPLQINLVGPKPAA